MPITLLGNTLNLCPSLQLTDQFSPPYKQNYSWVLFKLHVLGYRKTSKRFEQNACRLFANLLLTTASTQFIYLKNVYFTTFSKNFLAIFRLRFCQTICLSDVNVLIFGFLGASRSSSLLATEEFSLFFCIVFIFLLRNLTPSA